jgi:RNA polymerase sigma factor (sigma-70 family)
LAGSTEPSRLCGIRRIALPVADLKADGHGSIYRSSHVLAPWARTVWVNDTVSTSGNPQHEPAPHGEAPHGEGGESHAECVSRLFREHNRALVGFVYARVKSEPEAREIAQEAYVKLLQLDAPEVAGFLRAYLFRIAENLAFDRLRQRRSRGRLDSLLSLDEMDLEASAERTAIAREELALIEQAVSELPPKCQEAFRQHRLADLSIGDVARRMKVSERMVRKHIARALVYIRLRREGVPRLSAEAHLDELS